MENFGILCSEISKLTRGLAGFHFGVASKISFNWYTYWDMVGRGGGEGVIGSISAKFPYPYRILMN